jgi:hypothetical protein
MREDWGIECDKREKMWEWEGFEGGTMCIGADRNFVRVVKGWRGKEGREWGWYGIGKG